jgi:prepilin-type N-terminal cleavage/methylation domain-containing protein
MTARLPLQPASRPLPARQQRGFSLVELAVVLAIVAFTIGGMLMPLGAQRDIRARQDTEKQLADAKELLIAFAITNQRLPCPASPTSNGVESFCDSATANYPCAVAVPLQVRSHGHCSHPYNGFLPAATLGFTPIMTTGYANDGWSGEAVNQLRYAITDVSYSPTTSVCGATGTAVFPFTCEMGMKGTYMTLTTPDTTPDLQVCNSGGATVQNAGTTTAACSAGNYLTNSAVAVIYSVGKTAGTAGRSTDEIHNANPMTTDADTSTLDRVFVNAPPSANFDDQMMWISRYALSGRMISAGRLP